MVEKVLTAMLDPGLKGPAGQRRGAPLDHPGLQPDLQHVRLGRCKVSATLMRLVIHRQLLIVT